MAPVISRLSTCERNWDGWAAHRRLPWHLAAVGHSVSRVVIGKYPVSAMNDENPRLDGRRCERLTDLSTSRAARKRPSKTRVNVQTPPKLTDHSFHAEFDCPRSPQAGFRVTTFILQRRMSVIRAEWRWQMSGVKDALLFNCLRPYSITLSGRRQVRGWLQTC